MLETAIHAASSAGKLLRQSFGQQTRINETTAHDIKLQTDVDAQNLIYSILLKRFPEHKLVGEEGDAGNPRGEVEWIVDPLDGTVNFAMGIPHFCVSIAARRAGKMVLGVVYDPLREELFTAEAGAPALLNGKPIAVSQRSRLSEAILAIGFAKSKESVEYCLKLYAHYAHHAKKLRAMGSAALDMAYVAAGRLDAYIEQGISIWDIAAGMLLIERAGGRVESQARPDGKFKVCASSGNMQFPLK